MFSFFKKPEKSRKSGPEPELSPEKKRRQKIIAHAKETARQAAAEIGEDTLAKVREHLAQKQNSEFERALRKIRQMDQERIADNIRATYRDD